MVEDSPPTPTDNSEGKPEPSTPPLDSPKDEGISELDRAEEINKEKARLLEEDKKLTERKEKLQAVQMVGGQTVAGQEPVKETEDEKKVKGASKFFEGTQLEEDIKKANE